MNSVLWNKNGDKTSPKESFMGRACKNWDMLWGLRSQKWEFQCRYIDISSTSGVLFYSVLLSNSIHRKMVGRLVNNELERIWKETVT
jgi:hypothetical protein